MVKGQFLQGEQIDIAINGNNAVDLTTIEFGCNIYPVEDPTKAVNVLKANMTKMDGENVYIAHFVSSVTKNLPIGIYNFEFYDDTHDKIYPQPNIFNINTSVSKGFITSNS